MTTSTSRAAYTDCYALLDRALDRPAGIRIACGPEADPSALGTANQLRVRLHTARSMDRMEARKVYPPDDPAHGISVYDILVVKIKQAEEQWWVYIEPRGLVRQVEDIPRAAE